MQKWLYKILLLVGCAPVALANGPSAAPAVLKQADSLYAARQYTQAFERYQTLFETGHYSSAMLLKMAFIEEGLGHLSGSLYYLNTYYSTSNDAQALKKMEEMAEKNNLEGYKTDESTKLMAWWGRQYVAVTGCLAAIALFFLALIYRQRIKENQRPTLTGVALVMTLGLLFAHVNFSKPRERGIMSSPQTYLMSDASSGASVVAIIGEGHQLTIRSKKDVWLKVNWKDKEVFVRDFTIRPVNL
ncbi:MAG: hypothetical protein K2U26_04135 [Cyclobacteriaceae bacterium]|nr:hypothetical protein [Cyclobacteriaceae bacterium]